MAPPPICLRPYAPSHRDPSPDPTGQHLLTLLAPHHPPPPPPPQTTHTHTAAVRNKRSSKNRGVATVSRGPNPRERLGGTDATLSVHPLRRKNRADRVGGSLRRHVWDG